MALYDISKVLDTVIEWLEDQRPVYETLIDRYYEGRRLNIFPNRRPQIPVSSLPSIEVYPMSDTPSWHACRVQEDQLGLVFEITTDNADPVNAVRLEGALVELTTRILTAPVHLRAPIKGTRAHFYDSFPQGAQYGSTASQGRMRVATIPWTGKALEYLTDEQFPPTVQQMFTIQEPIV